MRGKEYSDLNPPPPTKVDSRGRRVPDIWKIREQQIEKDRQVQASAPTPRRPAGETTEYRAPSSPRIRQSVERLANIETPAESTLDRFIEKHDAFVKYEKERDARWERERAEQARVAEARRIENVRRAEMLQQEAERKRQETLKANQTLVQSLYLSEVESVGRSFGLSDADIRLVQQRITKAGLAEMPWMFAPECERFIADRDRVFLEGRIK